MQSEEPTIIQSLENHLAEYGHTTVGQDIAAAILVIKDLHQKAALSAAEPVDYQLVFSDGRTSRVLYSKDEADRFKKASDITVDIRALYAAPPAPSVAVKELQWDKDGDNLKARMGDREWMLNITSDGKTWAGSTRPFVFGRNLTWSSVPNCSMVSLEEAKAACQADCQSRYVALSAQVQDVAESELAYKEARQLAVSLHAEHYRDVTQWRPLDDLRGVISQIDNMVCGLVVKPEGWQLVPKELTPAMVQHLQMHTEMGAYVCENLSGAYSLMDEYHRAMLLAAPAKQEGC